MFWYGKNITEHIDILIFVKIGNIGKKRFS